MVEYNRCDHEQETGFVFNKYICRDETQHLRLLLSQFAPSTHWVDILIGSRGMAGFYRHGESRVMAQARRPYSSLSTYYNPCSPSPRTHDYRKLDLIQSRLVRCYSEDVCSVLFPAWD